MRIAGSSGGFPVISRGFVCKGDGGREEEGGTGTEVPPISCIAAR